MAKHKHGPEKFRVDRVARDIFAHIIYWYRPGKEGKKFAGSLPQLSRTHLATAVGCSVVTVSRKLKLLTKLGLIEVKQEYSTRDTHDGRGYHTTLYVVLMPVVLQQFMSSTQLDTTPESSGHDGRVNLIRPPCQVDTVTESQAQGQNKDTDKNAPAALASASPTVECVCVDSLPKASPLDSTGGCAPSTPPTEPEQVTETDQVVRNLMDMGKLNESDLTDELRKRIDKLFISDRTIGSIQMTKELVKSKMSIQDLLKRVEENGLPGDEDELTSLDYLAGRFSSLIPGMEERYQERLSRLRSTRLKMFKEAWQRAYLIQFEQRYRFTDEEVKNLPGWLEETEGYTPCDLLWTSCIAWTNQPDLTGGYTALFPLKHALKLRLFFRHLPDIDGLVKCKATVKSEGRAVYNQMGEELGWWGPDDDTEQDTKPSENVEARDNYPGMSIAGTTQKTVAAPQAHDVDEEFDIKVENFIKASLLSDTAPFWFKPANMQDWQRQDTWQNMNHPARYKFLPPPVALRARLAAMPESEWLTEGSLDDGSAVEA